MTDYEPFSLRLRNLEREGMSIPFEYDHLPDQFRGQVAHILGDTIGEWRYSRAPGELFDSSGLWRALRDRIVRELGTFELGRGGDDMQNQVVTHILNADPDPALDAIELSFRSVDNDWFKTNWERWKSDNGARLDPDQAVQDLNRRFRQYDLGHQFEGRIIAPVTSQFVHVEVVAPAVQLLQQPGFAGASLEFLRAHEHFRKGRNEEAISDASKSFESAMKVISDQQGWQYPSTATAKTLIKVMYDNGLLPTYLEHYFNSLQNVMESSLPTVRNKDSGHGRGGTGRDIPHYLAAYALHLAASNIVFLVEAFEAMKVRDGRT